MSDVQNLGIEVPGEQKPVEVIEQLATEFGWKSKEDYEASGGNPDNWIEPADYIRKEKEVRANLRIALEREKTEKEHTRRTLDSLKNHYMKLRETLEDQYKAEIQQLKQAKRTYLKEGETDQALLIEDQIDNLKEQHEKKIQEVNLDMQQQTAVDTSVVAQYNEELAVWKEANQWYRPDLNDKNTRLADDLAKAWVANNGIFTNMSQYRSMLKHIENEMKDLKPALFDNPKRSRGDRVDDGGGERKNSSSDKVPQFNEEQERVYKSLVDMEVKGSDGKIITRKQLWQEWKDIGAV